jgi:flavin-binding protein dodecin
MVQGAIPQSPTRKEEQMAKGKKGNATAAETVYKVVEVIGTSPKSWEDAAANAVETAASTLRDLRIAEVVKMDMKVEGGKVVAFRTRVLLSFKYEG